MIRPHREALGDQIEADETYVGGSEPRKRGRGAGGKAAAPPPPPARRTKVGSSPDYS
jgi:hypothetical protein